MARVLALCLGVLLVIAALTISIVFGRRRSFPANDLIVFEMGNQSLDLYSIQPGSVLGGKMNLLFQPQTAFADRYVSGIDCSPDSRALIFWYIYLYRFDLQDRALTQLTLGAGLSERSVWSPDGTRIAFTDDVADRQPREIFTVKADGTGKTQTTSNDLKETSLTWSPDSKRIAFTYVANADPSRSGLALVDLASGEQTTLYESAAQINDASWSPDGTRIAFDSGSGGGIAIDTIRADGSGLTRLGGAFADSLLPRWSPDGAMISFSARNPGEHYQLYVMGADGSNPYQVFIGLPDEDVFNQCWLTS